MMSRIIYCPDLSCVKFIDQCLETLFVLFFFDNSKVNTNNNNHEDLADILEFTHNYELDFVTYIGPIMC